MRNYEEIAVNRTYSLTMQHIGKVSDMSVTLGKGQSEIIRRAIDLLYEKFGQDQVEKQAEEINNPS